MNKQKGLAPILIVLFIALAVGGYLIYQKQTTKSVPQSSPIPVTSPVPFGTGETINWKTYTNTKSIKYEISYPSQWSIQSHESRVESDAEGITLIPSKQSEEQIVLRCPRAVGVGKNKLPEIDKYSPNEGNYIAKFKKDVEVNGARGLQYIWGNDEGNALHTALQKDVNSSVCELTQLITVTSTNYQQIIDSQKNYDQILSTFKFLDQAENPEGKFCGGIAANLPENQCPKGYTCQMDGNYPDAGGKCVKK